MSRYSHGGGSSGDHRQGGYNNGYRNGGYAYKINEDDVPESQHSIFVRGLPSSIQYDEIKNFFEDHIGPCSFDFQKVNYERNQLFVAVRFESKDHAKEAYNKYREEDILGCRCEVTWFRDIRRYISYQQQNGGGAMRRGNFNNRGGGGNYAGRYNNHRNGDYRKRRHSDRSRSRSYSDSDRSRSRSRRSSRSRSSRSRSRSEGERSTSRDSDRRRSESKEDKKRKKEKKVKKSSKKDRRHSRRSESVSSRSDGERSRSSSASERDRSEPRKKKNGRKEREASAASSSHSPLRLTPPPPAPIIGPVIPTAGSLPAAPIEKSAPLSDSWSEDSEEEELRRRREKRRKREKKRLEREEREREESEEEEEEEEEKEREKEEKKSITITIANRSTVPVENTSFKMQLDTDEPPRKIVRGPMTPEPREDEMEIEKEEEEVPLRKEVEVKRGGWRVVGEENTSGPPSDLAPESAPSAAPVSAHPPPALVQPALATASKQNGVNGGEMMMPRSVHAPPPQPSGGTPLPPPPKRLPPPGTPSATLPPPPPRPSSMGGGIAARYPEIGKVIREIKTTQDALIASVKPNNLRLSDLSAGESMVEKMEERERMINELDVGQKGRFTIKMKQITNSYKNDASTIATVVKSVVQKDPSLEEQIKPALLAVLEDLEKQIYKKVDDFLLCGL